MAEGRTASGTAAKQRFYVTRESQNADAKNSDTSKLSYVGMRNLVDLDKIEEQDIVSARGTIRGKKHRIRAGLANFENPNALEKRDAERGKVVVYVTSLHTVRATFEDCRYVLDLFHNLRIRVTTKDIYVSQFYHSELEGRLAHSGHISVPQIFIGGQHVGGRRELEELNEDGKLRKILEDYPRYETANNCEVCRGYELIPCRKCGGSKNSTANKFTSEFKALRCTHCDINGLEECPACVEGRKVLEDEIKSKETQQLEFKGDKRNERGGKREEIKTERAKEREKYRERGESRRAVTGKDVCVKKSPNMTDVRKDIKEESGQGGGGVDMNGTKDDYTEKEEVTLYERGVEEEEKADSCEIDSEKSSSVTSLTSLEDEFQMFLSLF